MGSEFTQERGDRRSRPAEHRKGCRSRHQGLSTSLPSPKWVMGSSQTGDYQEPVVSCTFPRTEHKELFQCVI